MKGNRRWLGWVAIGLGVLALMGALGGRSWYMGWHAYGPPVAIAPRVEPAPPQWEGPRDGLDVRREFEQRWQADSEYARGYIDGLQAARRFDGPWHIGPFFFWPFFLFGGLLRLLFVGLLLLLALKALGRWRGSGGQSSQAPPAQPGPEKPPYTGETQSL
jgi:hypothetical protein